MRDQNTANGKRELVVISSRLGSGLRECLGIPEESVLTQSWNTSGGPDYPETGGRK